MFDILILFFFQCFQALSYFSFQMVKNKYKRAAHQAFLPLLSNKGTMPAKKKLFDWVHHPLDSKESIS